MLNMRTRGLYVSEGYDRDSRWYFLILVLIKRKKCTHSYKFAVLSHPSYIWSSRHNEKEYNNDTVHIQYININTCHSEKDEEDVIMII